MDRKWPGQQTRPIPLPPEILPVLAKMIRSEIELWQVAHHVIPIKVDSDQSPQWRCFEGGSLGKVVPTLMNRKLYRV